MPLVTCASCGKEFWVKPFRIKRTKGTALCCSKSCRKKLGFTEVSCRNCGKVLIVHVSRFRNGHGKFCSWKCRFQWQSLKKRGTNSPTWKGGSEERVCPICGKLFVISRARINLGKARFCSCACRARDPENQAKLMQSQHRRPNKPEQRLQVILNKFFPQEWKYVGDGSLIINGLNPDFANSNGRKLVIEVFGEYWHSQRQDISWHRTELGRMMAYAPLGFKCLVIWDRDIKGLTEKEIALMVKQFVRDKK